MLITVTSPRKRMGQTITAIHLGASIAQHLCGEIVLVDTNRFCKDIEYYLSDSRLTKGLDDFFSLYHSGLLNPSTFKTCIKNACKHIDIMAANRCFEYNEREMEILLEYSNRFYTATILDTVGSGVSTGIAGKSDWIIVVIQQEKNILEYMERFRAPSCRDKLIIAVNRYCEQRNGIDIGYRLENIRQDLKKAGFTCPVFILEDDPELTNECNDRSVLNYFMNRQNRDRKYIRQMGQLAKYLLGEEGSQEDCGLIGVSPARSLLKMLPSLNLLKN